VSETRYVLWAATRLGLIPDYEDTENSVAFDAYLVEGLCRLRRQRSWLKSITAATCRRRDRRWPER
jgi:hypothetical protein